MAKSILVVLVLTLALAVGCGNPAATQKTIQPLPPPTNPAPPNLNKGEWYFQFTTGNRVIQTTAVSFPASQNRGTCPPALDSNDSCQYTMDSGWAPQYGTWKVVGGFCGGVDQDLQVVETGDNAITLTVGEQTVPSGSLMNATGTANGNSLSGTWQATCDGNPGSSGIWAAVPVQ